MTQPHYIDREAVAEALGALDSVEKIAGAQSDLRSAVVLFDAVNRSREIFQALAVIPTHGGGDT